MSGVPRHVAASLTAGSLALMSGPGAAQVVTAQDAAVDHFSRARNTSVRQRARPAYEASGIRTGSFTIYPRVEASAEGNDNIYATAHDRRSDTIWRVRPELAVESGWAQNSMSAYVRGAINRHQANADENVDEFGAGAAGRIDVDRGSSIGVGADFARGFEPRTAPSAPRNAIDPTGLNTAQAWLGASRAAGFFKLSARADWRSFDYEDGRTGMGAVIDQDGRDRDVVSLSGRIDMAASPDAAFFVQVTGNERTYDEAPPPLGARRDSRGMEYLLGANFELSTLVRGEVAVGYIEQSFDQPAFGDVSGFGARAQLEWFPSQLTTVQVAAGRTIEDTPVTGAGAFVANSASLAVDHELLRNVILTARLTWGLDVYEGVDREDSRFGASLGTTYLINRNLGVSLTATTLETRSVGAAQDQDFTVNRLAVALVAQF